MSSRTANQKGFTIIELLIATTVFSLVLLVASAAVVQIGKMYYKGLISSRTQDVTRSVIEDASRDLQFSNSKGFSVGAPDGDKKVYCLGDHRYTYDLGKQVASGVHGLVQDTSGDSCVPGDMSSTTTAKELLGENMRLTKFDISSLDGNKTYQISVGVAYGESDLLSTYSEDGSTLQGNLADTLCRSGITGSNFCATSTLDTTVKRRLN